MQEFLIWFGVTNYIMACYFFWARWLSRDNPQNSLTAILMALFVLIFLPALTILAITEK